MEDGSSTLVGRPTQSSAKWCERVLWGLAVLALVTRFVALEQHPVGFWLDEYLGGLHLGCMSQAGQSGYGVKWPLFVPGAAGGFYTPVFLYFGMLWTKVFGLSIASVRGVSAFFVTLTIAGIFMLARRLGGRRLALWATLLACLSPWSFQFSRVAWDPPIAPAFIVWLCYFWMDRRPLRGGALAGACFAAALYSYPPARIQTPLLFLVLLLLTWRSAERRWLRLGAFAVVSTLVAVPLLRLMLTSDFMGRSNSLAIFSRDYLSQHKGHSSAVMAFLWTLGDNLALYVRPSFLFFTGDPNIRHSTQFMGELGLLDDLALAAGAVVLLARLRRPADGEETGIPPVVVLGVSGILFGVLPAALTWEGQPHALRAIGAWPFFSLLGAAGLVAAERRWRLLVPVGLATACVHCGLFGWLYFHEYPRIAGEAMWVPLRESLYDLDRLTPEARTRFARDNPDALRFYMMRSGRYSCVESEEVRKTWIR